MQNNKTNNLYDYSVTKPWEFVLVTVMYAIGAVSFPPNLFSFVFGDSLSFEFLSLFLIRILCCIIPLWLIFSIKLKNTLSLKSFFKRIIVIIPFIIIAVNNFPIVSLITGDATLNGAITTFEWIFYLFAVLGGVVLEELCFRGLIFPVLLRKYRDKKNYDFICVLYSALIFGCVHIINLLGGAGIGSVIMQIGYSFLIGAMCAIAFLKTGNLFHAILLHFIYNVGGLLLNYNLVFGNVWSVAEIIVTAILSVIVVVYSIAILIFDKRNDITESL